MNLSLPMGSSSAGESLFGVHMHRLITSRWIPIMVVLLLMTLATDAHAAASAGFGGAKGTSLNSSLSQGSKFFVDIIKNYGFTLVGVVGLFVCFILFAVMRQKAYILWGIGVFVVAIIFQALTGIFF
jgi:hypothetical protein